MILYSELSSNFQILDYACTHSQLLLRSDKNRNRDYNIDILFKPVNALFIPSYFRGLEISINDFPDQQKVLIDEYGFNIEQSNNMFMIKNAEGKLFFINASIFCVYHNKQITPCESGLKDGRGGYSEAFGEKVMCFPLER